MLLLPVKVAVSDIGPCKKRVAVEVEADRVKAEVEEHLQQAAARVQLPGFRRGKAPMALVERRIRAEVEEEARDHLLAESWREAVSQEKLHPLSDPGLEKVEFDLAKGLRYEAILEVRPEFDLPALSGIPLQRLAAAVSDADLDQATADLKREHRAWDPAEAGAALKKGELAVCALSLFDGVKSVWSRDGVGVVLNESPLGELPTGPAEKFLEGYKAGEVARMVAAMPQDFPREDLRGRMLTIAAEVREVRRERSPSDEELAKAMGAASPAALRESLRAHVQRHKEGEARRLLEEDLVTHLIGKVRFDLPQDILQAQAENLLRRTAVDLLTRGVPEKQLQENLEKLKSGSLEAAERRMRASLILSRVAEKEKILVTESDVEDHIRQMAASYGERPEGIRKRLEVQGGLSVLRASIREAKAVELLISRAQVT